MNCLRTTIMILTALSAFQLRAQEPADTVQVLENATNIIVAKAGTKTTVSADLKVECDVAEQFIYEVDVVENDTTESIVINDSWGVSIPFLKTETKHQKRKFSRNIVGLEHLYWGWRFNYHDRQHVKNCFELGARNFIALSWSSGVRNKSTFSIGLGFGLQRYLADEGFVYGKSGDRLVLTPKREGMRVDKSRMDLFVMHVPFLYKQAFARRFNFTIGAIANINRICSAFTEYYEGATKYKEKYKGFQQNLFTADIFASLGFNEGFGVYFTWSPMNIFNKSFGPELRSFSVGVDLMTF